ncbi:stage IV sporulation protein A [Metallumcola ferriviriculae]|uniref:Stage IV sporulation protein A n=1 Tax=Metallumcola ferriviriculae TaxID=3039180 RepID=A0AAU0URS7_9FIRM|nr:stage IV sporulation protein A [Desulfitibacteraceae bacterium MK1]
MQKYDIFKDISERTGGDIYLGVVGPVRTGKSTFIKRFMDLMVLPNIIDANDRTRAVDELPQSGAGKTIMTTEPKFIPADAVGIRVKEGLEMNVRLVDCVGYAVPGALGYEEEGGPRMVKTPWYDEEIPFQDAAETGTRKVIEEHSTIGLVVVTDGSVTDIQRDSYLGAEERVISELKELNKPFVVVLNSSQPYAQATVELAHKLEQDYDVPVLPLDCAQMSSDDIYRVLEEALYEFPISHVNVNVPKWIQELRYDHWLRFDLENLVTEAVDKINRLRDVDVSLEEMGNSELVGLIRLNEMNLGTGEVNVELEGREGLFYEMLQEETGYTIEDDHTLFKLMKELSVAKKEYDTIAMGYNEAKATGYGIVTPSLDEMELVEPELIRKGGNFGVRLTAKAASYHLIKADITTSITPLIGTEKQCEDLVTYIMGEFEEDPQRIWDTEIFGKSLHELVREGIQGKLYRMPENARDKLRETLQRIANDGSGGLICIII